LAAARSSGLDSTDPADVIRLEFRGGSGPSEISSYRLRDAANILNDNRFDSKKQTVLYFHGMSMDLAAPGVEFLDYKFRTTRQRNFVLFNWSNYTYDETNRPNFQQIGDVAAQYLSEIFNRGYHPSNIYFIGHSTGANVAGYVSRRLRNIPRLTALDPGHGPQFDGIIPVRSGDAGFLDVSFGGGFL
jgi:acetyl esterase/lipase